MERIIFDIENVSDILDEDMVGRSWIMTPQGLECVDCTGMEMTLGDDGNRNRSLNITVRGDDENGRHGKHIILHKDHEKNDFDEEDIKNESGKKVIIRKKIKDGDKESDKKIIIEKEMQEEKNN